MTTCSSPRSRGSPSSFPCPTARGCNDTPPDNNRRAQGEVARRLACDRACKRHTPKSFARKSQERRARRSGRLRAHRAVAHERACEGGGACARERGARAADQRERAVAVLKDETGRGL